MAATSEIVEVRDELDILRHFHRSNRLRLKLRATESQCKSSHAYPSPNSRTRLTDAIDFNTSPVLLSREIQQRSKLKKPLEVYTSRGASRGVGASESPSLKQALRKLCISHASEMAATRRSVTIEARNLLDKGRSNAIETPKVLRDKEIVEERNGIKGKANSKASVNKGKQEAVPALGTTIRILNLSKICRIHCKTKPDSIGSSSCNNVAKENLCSREKGECSQSSKSSLGDYSSSTSMSEGSSCFGSSTNCNRPHMSKDVRWAAVHSVVMEQGSLGVKNFKLVRRLGYGDIGTVYLAELINTGCLFALKVMDIELLVRRRKMIRVQTEREIMQILDHPFLPTLYAHFTSDNLAFLVMEYCPGGDLHILRQKQPGKTFQEPAARFYVAEVLLTLEYLHMLGVIYRDLKPENILVREDGHIMLSDFDLSLRCNAIPTLLQSSSFSRQQQPKKSPEPRTQPSCIKPFCLQPSCDQVSCFSPRSLKTYKIKPDPSQSTLLPQLVVEPTDARSNSFVGTHEYLAPEIITGDGHGSSVDWWTLGIFLYELLFGRTPFKGSGNEETLSNVVSRGLSFPESPAVGHHVKDLIRGLLRKDPESRLGSVKGAAEIKQHPFFEGLNWALIRCAAPPEVPRNCDEGISHTSNIAGGKRISSGQVKVIWS